MVLRQSLLLCLLLALLAASCQAAATPAPPPDRPRAVSPVSTGEIPQATLARFRGLDECQSGPEFELSYLSTGWDLQDSTLVHRDLVDCTLQLAAHGQQVDGPKAEELRTLAGKSWQVSRFPSEGLSSYWLEEAGGCYLFVVQHGAQASAQAAQQCTEAAESVIDSFQLVEQ